MIRRVTIALVIVPLVCAISQDLPSNLLEPSKVAEELFTQQDLDLNYEELYESVLQYLASPLDINKATAEQLKSLFLLNDRQIADLLEHKERNGNLLSLYELQSIDSFDPDVIRKL